MDYQRQFEGAAKPGDLIQISRGTYEHWAIYIGGDELVHLIPSGDSGNLLTLLDSRTATVRREKMWSVVREDEFAVNNHLDGEYVPRERHRIVEEACRLVGQERPYSLTSYNCEHFVTELRYGKPESRQVDTAATIGGVALAGVGIVALGGLLYSLFKGDEKEEEEETQQQQRQRQQQQSRRRSQQRRDNRRQYQGWQLL